MYAWQKTYPQVIEFVVFSRDESVVHETDTFSHLEKSDAPSNFNCRARSGTIRC